MTRSFAERSLERHVIDDMIDVARRAPSAGFSQGTYFLVLSDEARHRFWDLTEAAAWLSPGVRCAPHIVLPLADPAAYTSRYAEDDKAGHGLDDVGNWPVPYWMIDTAMATQNLLLVVEQRGLGALFFGIFRSEQRLLAEFGVPRGVRPIGAIALGFRADDDRRSGSPTRRRRKPLERVVHHQRWSSSES
jgi:nitroreductase